MNPVSAHHGAASARATTRQSPRARRNWRIRTSAVLALTVTVLSSLTLGPSPASAAAFEPAATLSAVRTQLDVALNDVVAAGVPGIIVRVQDADHAARSSAAGVSDLATGAKLRPAAQFRIGSITKTFVATIVLQLVGEGRLRLDERIARRLPGLLTNGEQITVRQLLNHTSGLPDYTGDPELFAGIRQNRLWEPRELVALAERQPQLYETGSAWA